MLIGVISDTHSYFSNTHKALALLRSVSVDLIIHCGDVGSIKILKALSEWKFYFIWGNADKYEFKQPKVARAYLKKNGLFMPPNQDWPIVIPVEGKSILLYHGHEKKIHRLRKKYKNRGKSLAYALYHKTYAKTGKRIDYTMSGHTHKRRNKLIDGVRMINPGSVAFSREKIGIVASLATLNTDTDKVTFYAIKAKNEEFTITDK